VWRSVDSGLSFEEASGQAAGARGPVREVESLVVDPRAPDRVYAGTWRQAYRSLDGGRTWTAIGRGMDLDRDVFSIALDPEDPDALLAGTCGFLYASADAGARWQPRGSGIAYGHRRVQAV